MKKKQGYGLSKKGHGNAVNVTMTDYDNDMIQTFSHILKQT